MDTDQTAPAGCCMLKRILNHFSRRQKQTTFVVFGGVTAGKGLSAVCDCGNS